MTDEEKENDRRIFQNEHIVGRGRQTGMQNSLLKNRENYWMNQESGRQQISITIRLRCACHGGQSISPG